MQSNNLEIIGQYKVNNYGENRFGRSNPKRTLYDWVEPRFLKDARMLGAPTISAPTAAVPKHYTLEAFDIEEVRKVWLSKDPTIEEIASVSDLGLSVQFFRYAISHAHNFQREQMLPNAIDFASSCKREDTRVNRKALADFLNLEVPRLREISPTLSRPIDGVSLATQLMLDKQLYPHFCEGKNGVTFNRVNVIAGLLGGYDDALITIAEIRFLRKTSRMLL